MASSIPMFGDSIKATLNLIGSLLVKIDSYNELSPHIAKARNKLVYIKLLLIEYDESPRPSDRLTN